MPDLNFAQASLGALLGFLFGLARNLPSRARSHLRNAARSKFWNRPSKGSVDLVFTAYEIEELAHGLDMSRVESATGFRVVSTGMARTVAIIQQFARVDMKAEAVAINDETGAEDVAVSGDQLLIILGNEVNNDLARHYMDRIRDEFDLPYQFAYDAENNRIEVHDSGHDVVYGPERQGDHWTKDYAVIIRVRLTETPSRDLLIISGCHMWGMWSAALAITDAKWMKDFSTAGRNVVDQVILIETDVVGGHPRGARPIEFQALRRARPGTSAEQRCQSPS